MLRGVELAEGAQWRKSSFSASGDCLEWSIGIDNVRLRDSKSQPGTELLLSHSEWRAFLEGVKAGEADIPVQ
jgi:Domain of unknown function (DUF397)